MGFKPLLVGLLLSGLLYGGVNLFVRLAAWWADRQTVVTNGPQDTTPPATPRLLITNRVVKENTISLTGFSEPDSEVSLINNDQSISTIKADSNGQFTFTDVNLVNGENAFSVKAKDQADNFSQASTSEIVTFDKQPPELKIESPANGSDFRGAENQTIEIRGSTEENARVWINDKLVIVGSEGKFVSTYRLNQGTQDLKIKTIDAAGNESEQVLSVSYSP